MLLSSLTLRVWGTVLKRPIGGPASSNLEKISTGEVAPNADPATTRIHLQIDLSLVVEAIYP